MALNIMLHFLAASTLISTALAYSARDHPNKILRVLRIPNPDDGPAALKSIPPTSTENPAPIYSANATYTQYTDHSNPSAGTFEQFYYYGTEFWKGPGSPVILMTPGEGNATGYDSYLHDKRTTGVLAKELGAAVIVIEHRYWGTSTPCSSLSTKCLQHLTLNQSITDFTRFAKEAKLPFDPSGASNADKAPWIFIGGSYPGAMAAWTVATAKDTFWAYWASSAPTQAMNYWQYFNPIQEGMPKNCSTDVSLVVGHIDEIGTSGTKEQQKALQKMFGFEDLEHFDDFASALQNGPWLWQGNAYYYNSGFFDFCDAVEGVNDKVNKAIGANSTSSIPGPEGVGLQKALEGYAAWSKITMIPGFCADFQYPDWRANNSVGCFDSYNASSPFYTDYSNGNTIDRQWVWMTCNEPFKYWQGAAPEGRQSIVSRLVTADYFEKQCALYFPEEDGFKYGIAAGATVDDVNARTGGWLLDGTERLLYVNGQYDPWRDAGVSSVFRPGGPRQSTEQIPVVVLPGGFHCSDLVPKNGDVNPGAKKAIDEAVATMVKWTKDYYTNKT